MNNTEAGTSFVGTLVRRQYKSGQRYIQLVFDTKGGKKLSLSRNLDMVRSLQVGATYRIEGVERTLAGRQYVHEPLAIPLPYTSKRSRTLRFAAFGSAACLLLGGVVFAGAQLRDEPVQSSAVVQRSNTDAKAPVSSATDAAEPTGTTATQPTESTPSTTTKPASKTKSTNTSTAASTTKTPTTPASEPQTPVAPVAAPPAVADCEFEAVPFKRITKTDDSQDEGVQSGKEGQNKVCYPDGRSGERVVEVITAPEDEITIVHSTP